MGSTAGTPQVSLEQRAGLDAIEQNLRLGPDIHGDQGGEQGRPGQTRPIPRQPTDRDDAQCREFGPDRWRTDLFAYLTV